MDLANENSNWGCIYHPHIHASVITYMYHPGLVKNLATCCERAWSIQPTWLVEGHYQLFGSQRAGSSEKGQGMHSYM